MGTDIHLYPEVLRSGIWELGVAIVRRGCHLYPSHDDPYLYENDASRPPRSPFQCAQYDGLFERLAGVRGSRFNAISEPKGFPHDASEFLRAYADWVFGDDAFHSPSWLTLAELEAGLEGFEHGGEFIDRTMPALRELGDGDSVRLVFWFDN